MNADRKTVPLGAGQNPPAEEVLLIPGYRQFGNDRSEAGPLCNVLAHEGVISAADGQPLSEALLFGIAGGVGCGYSLYQGKDNTALSIGTRMATQETAQGGFLPEAAARLGLNVRMLPAASAGVAQSKLKHALHDGWPAIVWVNAGRLPYYAPPAACHALVVFGLDEINRRVSVADRFNGPLVLTPAALTAARQEETAPAYRAMLAPARPERMEPTRAVLEGLRACCQQMEEGFGPRNARDDSGLRAWLKWADLLVDRRDPRGWPRLFPPGPRLFAALLAAYEQIENRGRDGAAFRPLFAEFLEEAGGLAGLPDLRGVAALFREAARQWKELAAALLPDGVAPFKEARQLTARKRALFAELGLASADALQSVQSRLDEIRLEVEWAFPLSPAEAGELCAVLRGRLLAIHQVESQAIQELHNLVKGA